MNKAFSRSSVFLAFAILAVAVQIGWADTEVGIDTVDHGVYMSADVPCSISLTIEPATSGLPADQTALSTAFTGGATADSIDFGTVILAAGSSYPLSGGGDLYVNAGDSSVNVVGALAVTIQHNCGTAPDADIELTSPPSAGTVRWDNAHNGGSWETSNYNEVTASPAPFTFTNGSPAAIDLALNIPQATAEGTISSAVVLTVTAVP